jgi:hypothetical protein
LHFSDRILEYQTICRGVVHGKGSRPQGSEQEQSVSMEEVDRYYNHNRAKNCDRHDWQNHVFEQIFHIHSLLWNSTCHVMVFCPSTYLTYPSECVSPLPTRKIAVPPALIRRLTVSFETFSILAASAMVQLCSSSSMESSLQAFMKVCLNMHRCASVQENRELLRVFDFG